MKSVAQMKPVTIVLTGVLGSGNPIRTGPNRYEVTVLVPVSEVANKLGSSPFANLRVGCPDDPAARKSADIISAIRTQLARAPSDFAIHNKGIVLIADNLVASPGVMTITYSDPTFLREHGSNPAGAQQIRGIADGGTTTGAIKRAVDDGVYPNSNGGAFARLTVLCGPYTRSEVQGIVVGLNKTHPSGKYAAANYNKEFDEISNFVTSAAAARDGVLFPKVRFFPGDTGSYEIEKILQLGALFSMTNKRGEPIPEKSYAGGSLKYYQSEKGKIEWLSYLRLLPDVLDLYEYIIAKAHTAYNERGSFFSLTLFERMRIPPTKLPFSGLESITRDESGWVFPVLAAFIPNVRTDKRGWWRDPRNMFDTLAPDLIYELNRSFRDLGGKKGASVSVLGRNPLVYRALRSIVSSELVGVK